MAADATTEDPRKCTTAVEGGCPPTGTWRLTIAAIGWKMRDPQGGGGSFDVAYRSGGRLQMRPTIEHPPYPNTNNGGWCADTDPLSTWITPWATQARRWTSIRSDATSVEFAQQSLKPPGHA